MSIYKSESNIPFHVEKIMAKRNIPAVAYLRVSGRSQTDGDGFPRQRAAIKRYAKRHGYELIDEYTDAGVSGTKELAHRAGLAALLDRIESNGIKVVLVERADRLARDLLVGEVILRQFMDAGVSVIEASGGTELTGLASDKDDPTRKLIRQVLGAVSEFEKSVIVLKLRAARDRKRRTVPGWSEGAKPFGFFHGEESVLNRIRELRRKPKGRPRPTFQSTADTLNAEGLETRTGVPWTRGSVYAICKREGWQ